jgi:hypothetical protein
MKDVKDMRSKKGNRIVIIIGLKAHDFAHLASPNSDQIPAELIPSVGETLRYDIHKAINIWNKRELNRQLKETIIAPIERTCYRNLPMIDTYRCHQLPT